MIRNRGEQQDVVKYTESTEEMFMEGGRLCHKLAHPVGRPGTTVQMNSVFIWGGTGETFTFPSTL
jgi:low affinity Fe/Cu permease